MPTVVTELTTAILNSVYLSAIYVFLVTDLALAMAKNGQFHKSVKKGVKGIPIC
jgi:hypothetical protein